MIDKIFNEDCLIGMQRIPDKSIDCIICDLPYGTTKNHWDSLVPLDKLWKEYKRIIKDNGAIVLFAQTPFDKVLGASNLEMLKYEWIWQKEMGTGFLNANFAPMKEHENILVFSKAAASVVKDKSKAMIYNPQYKDGKPYTVIRKKTQVSTNYDFKNMANGVTTENCGFRFPTSILYFKRDKEKLHPTAKPVDLIRYLIRTYTIEGDLVLDNCVGSGTTAIAAMRENRHFIGFELEKKYYDIACKRIEEERQNLKLKFDD